MVLTITRLFFWAILVITTFMHFVCKNIMVKKTMYYGSVAAAAIYGVANYTRNTVFPVVITILVCLFGYVIYLNNIKKNIIKEDAQISCNTKNDKKSGKNNFIIKIIMIIEVLFMMLIFMLECGDTKYFEILFLMEKIAAFLLVVTAYIYIVLNREKSK